MRNSILFALVGASALSLSACNEAPAASETAETTQAAETDATANAITAEEVTAAQQAWGEGIVGIGKTFTEEGDVKAAAEAHINKFYAYEDGDTVLFKPTLAAEDQFRGSFDEALSYFIGTDGTEDVGFAIKPWTKVRWENEGTVIDSDGNTAMAMGNYYFTDTDGKDTKVEYTFGYKKNADGDLVITLHHSSIPFSAS